MPTFAVFTVVEFTCTRGGVGSPFSHYDHRHELTKKTRLINMDQVLSIAHNSAPKIGIQTSDLGVIGREEPLIVATREIEAWLNDNPQFGGRSRLHLIDQEGDR